MSAENKNHIPVFEKYAIWREILQHDPASQESGEDPVLFNFVHSENGPCDGCNSCSSCSSCSTY